MGRRWKRLPDEKRRLIIKLAAQGCSYRQIADQAQVAQGSVGRVVRPLGGVIRAELVEVPVCRLSLDDRIEIKLGLERGETFAVIGARIGRHRSAVSREIKAAERGRDGYRPTEAHARAVQRWKRHKDTKLALNPVLCARVVDGLERLWSPQQIAQRLRVEFGDDRSMHISHETIYRSLYVQGRGELRRELAACLRTGRAARRPQGGSDARGKIPGMVMISERPAEVADRAVPGHWEGDLIIGRNGKSAIGTLVERSTRFVLLLHLPDGRTADQVREAMTAKIATLPEALRRSITWDQGHEMAGHARFSIDTGIAIYFCDPHSPWQRGSNENTNGLLRQYFPKGTDLSVHDAAKLAAVEDSINGRPRQTLGWMTPSEKLNELLGVTTG